MKEVKYFATVEEDKFLKSKSFEGNHRIGWSAAKLASLMPESPRGYVTLSLTYVYDSENTDALGFIIIIDGANMPEEDLRKVELLLLIDEDATLELLCLDMRFLTKGRSGSHYGGSFRLSTAQLIKIAHSKRIEYSLRWGNRNHDDSLTKEELLIFKGFFHDAFDPEFEKEQMEIAAKENSLKSFTADAIAKKAHGRTDIPDDKDLLTALREENAAKKAQQAPTESSSCYIATACFEDANAPEVILFRKYRDNILLQTNLGKKFCSFYYRSYPILRHLAPAKSLRARLIKVVLICLKSILTWRYKLNA